MAWASSAVMGPVRNPDGGHEAKGEGNEFHDREKLVEQPPTRGNPAFVRMEPGCWSSAVPAEKKAAAPDECRDGRRTTTRKAALRSHSCNTGSGALPQ
jgi:hypothetical protein